MNELRATVEQVKHIVLDFHITSLIPRFNAIESVLQEENIVDVVIVGRFKAGKSSFLNQIIGKDILPVAVLPATAVITRIFHGAHDRIVIRYLNGRGEEASLEKLEEYVTEQMNPDNEKSVATVDVELAGLRELRGIRFVDTPGLGSVFKHNTETAMNWLPRVGAAILAISIDHPLSEQDIELLRELTKHTPETVILLTKVDLVTERQMQEVLRFLESQIEKRIGRELQIFPFSIRSEYARSREIFLNEYLTRRIVEKSAETRLRIMKHKAGTLISECRSYLDLARAAASAAEQARSELIKQLRVEKEELEAVQNEIMLLSIDMKTKLRTTATEKFLLHYSEVSRQARLDFQESSKEWKGNLAVVAKMFQEWLKRSLTSEMQRISPDEGAALIESLKASRSAFQRVVRAFHDRMASHIKEALQMSFEGAVFEINVARPTTPDIRVDRVFDTPFELIWFLIPMFPCRPLFIKYFKESLPWEIEKNLHRSSVQWADAICGCIDEMARSSIKFIRSELNTIEGMVSNRNNRLEDIEQTLLRLESVGDLY